MPDQAELPCSGTHDGPFFYERKDVFRCEGCRTLVSVAQMRASWRATQAPENTEGETPGPHSGGR